MGVIYTKTSDGKKLREINKNDRNMLLEKLYHPYHIAISKGVQELLNKYDKCLIIDGHSFPAIPLPYESNQESKRPHICIGTAEFHSSPDLIAFILNFFERLNLTKVINKPFKGCFVPLKFLHKDKRVKSIMIEINRELYLNEKTGEKNDSFEEIKNIISDLIKEIIAKLI